MITEVELWDRLNSGEAELGPGESRLWELIRVLPEKWERHPYGDATVGFWVVGVFGTYVVWFNNIEDGFNISRYEKHGVIRDYWANQDTLMVIQRILNAVTKGYDLGPFCGPPQPGVFPS